MAKIEYDGVVFEWDDNKSASNKIKHGLSFETAHLAFFDDNALTKFHKMVDGEERYKTLAKIEGQILVLFIGHLYNYDENGNEYIRLITARVAEKNEEKEYYNA